MSGRNADPGADPGDETIAPAKCVSCQADLHSLIVEINQTVPMRQLIEVETYKWAPYAGVYIISPGRLRWVTEEMGEMECRCPACGGPVQMQIHPDFHGGAHGIEPTKEQLLSGRL